MLKDVLSFLLIQKRVLHKKQHKTDQIKVQNKFGTEKKKINKCNFIMNLNCKDEP